MEILGIRIETLMIVLGVLLVVCLCLLPFSDLLEAKLAALRSPEDDVTAAKREIDDAAYKAEAEMRRIYTERTGRKLPAPNQFKYGGQA